MTELFENKFWKYLLSDVFNIICLDDLIKNMDDLLVIVYYEMAPFAYKLIVYNISFSFAHITIAYNLFAHKNDCLQLDCLYALAHK